jgi:hypothetical protein
VGSYLGHNMRNIFFILFIILYSSCHRHDRFNYRTFKLDEATLLASIDSLHIMHPQYRAPSKWTIHDGFSYSMKMHNTSERRFYFSAPIEEMYYVTISAYDGETKMIICAVHTNKGWHLEKDLAPSEIRRIEKRFDDKIISKLEVLTNSRCTTDDSIY